MVISTTSCTCQSVMVAVPGFAAVGISNVPLILSGVCMSVLNVLSISVKSFSMVCTLPSAKRSVSTNICVSPAVPSSRAWAVSH